MHLILDSNFLNSIDLILVFAKTLDIIDIDDLILESILQNDFCLLWKERVILTKHGKESFRAMKLYLIDHR